MTAPRTLDQMIENMHDHARGVLIGRNDEQLMPFFLIQFKDRPDAIMPAPFTGERQKSMLIGAMRAALKHFRPSVVNYSFVSEAWVATQDRPPRQGDLTPSQREDKCECVIVSAGDRDGARMKMWEIVRDGSGRVIDLVEDKGDAKGFEGRLYNLMGDDDD